MSTRKIIVVDDNEILLRAWERILSGLGYHFFTTTQPEEALELLHTEGADLLISDIVMPQLDGFDLMQRIQGMENPPRILLTTGYLCDFKQLKLEFGTREIHVLMKPYNDLYQLESFIRRLLDDDPSLNDSYPDNTCDDSHVRLWSL